AAASGVYPDHLVPVHLERGDDGVLLHPSVCADDLDVVRRALVAAVERPRQVPVPRVGAGEVAAVRADAVVDDDPVPAAVLTLAARLVVQPQLVDVEAV